MEFKCLMSCYLLHFEVNVEIVEICLPNSAVCPLSGDHNCNYGQYSTIQLFKKRCHKIQRSNLFVSKFNIQRSIIATYGSFCGLHLLNFVAQIIYIYRCIDEREECLTHIIRSIGVVFCFGLKPNLKHFPPCSSLSFVISLQSL